MNEEIKEKIDKSLLKADDWWGRHNITTRFITLASVVLLIVLTIADTFFGVKAQHFDIMFQTISDMVLYITLGIILGVNGLAKIADIIKAKNGQA